VVHSATDGNATPSFRLLGPLEVTVGGRRLETGGAKQRAVLAALLLRPGAVVPLERLVEDVWGEEPPAAAAHSVAAYVSRLRAELTPHGVAIERRGRGYVLATGTAAVDATEFTRLAADAARASEAGDHPRAAALAADALALWRGDVLADVPLHGSAGAEAARLEELRLGALEQRIEAQLHLGAPAGLVPELRTLVEAHPYRERLVAQLMLALSLSGRQAEALQVYEATRVRLDEDLGLKPSRDLQRLSGRIVRQEPMPGARAAEPDREPDGGAEDPSPASTAGRAPPVTPAPPRPRRRGPPARALAVLLVAVAALATALALGRGDGSGNAVDGVAGNTLAAIDPDSGRVVSQVPVGTAPAGVAAGGGGVWVANSGDGTVDRIDLATRTVRQTVAVGSDPTGVAAGAGAVWVVDGLEGTLVRVSPASNRVTQRIRVGNAPSAVAVGAGWVWVVARDDHTLVRVDPETGRVRSRTPTGRGPAGVAVGEGGVWVAAQDGTVHRADPGTGRQLGTIPVGSGPTAVVADGGAVWVAHGGDGTVSRIDPARGVVTATVDVGGHPSGLAVGAAALWVTTESGGEVVRVGLSDLAVTRIPVGGRPAGVSAGADGVLVTMRSVGGPHTGGTLRVAADVRSIDTADGAWSVIGLTNDGLTAFRRTGGRTATEVVPGLADAVPRPLDGGRTYVFRLRPGIRYSTGREVVPGDVRATVERLFARGTPDAGSLSAIAGAEACLRRPAGCDLGRGIRADRSAGTVTFRLVRPDPDLPAKLALPFAAIVPAGTPARGTGTRPLPATGPYMVADFRPGRYLRLVRNPRHDETGSPARPAAHPDEILMRLDVPERRRAGEAIRDRLDVVDVTGVRDLGAIRVRHGERLHTSPSQAVLSVFLNTRRPPFDDPDVRRALNLAVDRGRAVAAFGGAVRAAPTCQALPANSPGYAPYCPFRGGLAAARRLVPAERAGGAPVTVWAPPDAAGWVRPVVTALGALGYRARLRILDDGPYWERIQRGEPGWQAGFHGWVPNYPAATEALVPFTCGEVRREGANVSGFCDPEVERLHARALALQATDPAGAATLWSAVDRAITDRAPVVPLFTPRVAHLVSSRAGNVQIHHVWGVLLDQVWVR
jgi:peptide/nickel transport system substrate-binding protein